MIGSLLAEDVTWGVGGRDDVRTCHNRVEVLATCAAFRDAGVRAELVDLLAGEAGHPRRVGDQMAGRIIGASATWQVYGLRAGLIATITGFEDGERDRYQAGIAAR